MALAALTSAYDTSSDSDEDITDIKELSVPKNDGIGVSRDLDVQIISNAGKGIQNKDDVGSEKPLQNSETERKDDTALSSAPVLDFSTLKQGVQNDDDVVLLSGDAYVMPQIKQEPLSEESEDSEEDSDFSESDSDTAESEDEENSNRTKEKKKKKKQDDMEPPRVKGELTFKDLPPIEDLHISVPHEQAQPIGTVKSFVDPLVIVEAYPNTPALDIDSVLFLDEGDRALGHVYDVIGPVKQPLYCVRFNSLDHIQKSGITKGMLVYCAPRTQHASFVLLAQLEKYKGTDASWKHDLEPPPEEIISSEDEFEKNEKNKSKRRTARVRRTANPSENGNQETHQGPQIYQPSQVPGFYRPGPVYNPRPNHRGRRFPRHQRFQNPQNPPFNPFTAAGHPNGYGQQAPSNFPNSPYGSQIPGSFYPQSSHQPQYPYSGSNHPHPQPPPGPSQYHNPYAPVSRFPMHNHPYVQNPSWQQSQQQVPPQRPLPPPPEVQPPPPGV